MGGKNSTTKSTVSIPPEVLQRYSSVNANAENVAQTPFQVYSQDPSAFVAPVNATQQAGISGTNAYANQAQPAYQAALYQLLGAQQQGQAGITGASASGGLGGAYGALNAANSNASPLNQQAGGYYQSAYQGAQPYNQGAAALYGQGVAGAQPFNQEAASGLAGAYSGAQPYNQVAAGLGLSSAQAVNPGQLDINQYMSPYIGQVLGSTQALLNQQNQIEQSGQTGNAIKSGAFGGDRSGIAAANLAGQQRLSNSKIYTDILNQGYSQALGAAQQQQGVGLGAAQSNRAAQAQAGQQLAQLGQQTYGQGTGTAQAQAALGQQVFGQGLAGGQAYQGLGQQVYGQGTGTGSAVQGLGQQVFGQGLASSQQAASLAGQDFQQQMAAAQAQYGMGSQTAEQLAGLGTASQTAGLQGAQAQLGAGQVAQTTDQAGKQALYNQFLQQQSYPFQVAQFLANIAMGTGSLSGSTTTTTQPGGFFSDERLKENIKHVGKTFDGQPIVTYSYKDEPNVVRLGLIAQNVEKKHPDAVGESHGFKTVDYGKATEDAAARGKFASGGTPILPGLSPSDFSAILQAQQEMYTPYGGGLYGGSASGAPHGGSSYVPAASVAVSPLTVASPAAPPPSPFDDIKDIVDLADTAQEGLGKIQKKRDKKATGGTIPYQGLGLDIPDEKSEYELPSADPAKKPKSGFSKAIGAAKTAATVAAMFADGGAVDDPDAMKWNDRAANVNLGLKMSGEAPISGQQLRSQILASKIHNAGPPQAAAPRAAVPAGESLVDRIVSGARRVDPGRIIGDYLGGPHDPGTVIGGMLGGLGGAKAADPVAVRQTAQSIPPQAPPRVQSRPSAVAAPSGGLAPPQMAPASVPAEVSPPTTGLAPPVSAELERTPPQANITPTRGGLGDAVGDAAHAVGKSPVGGYFSKLGHGDMPAWMSLLSGIAAAGTAPTVHPGVALAAGLGAGSKSYLNALEKQQDIAQKAAEVKTEGERPAVVRAQASLTGAQTLAELNRLAALNGMVVVEDPAGEFVFDGKHYAARPKGSLLAKGVVPPTGNTRSSVIGDAGHEVAQTSLTKFGTLPDPVRMDAQKELGDIQNAGAAAQRAMLGNREYGAALSQMKDGPLQPGAFSAWGRNAANVANSVVDLIPGLSPEQRQSMKFDPTGLDAAMIVEKSRIIAAQARAQGAGQENVAGLERSLAAAPHEGMTRNAGLTVWAQGVVQDQQAIDIANYMAGVDNEAQAVSGMSRNFLPGDAIQAFWKDNPSSKYDTERARLTEMAKQPQYTTWLQLLQSGDPKKAQDTARKIDEIYGPVMSRYLTGGQ